MIHRGSFSRPKMRRYYRAAIFVIALLSLLAFLVYKHEYERLKTILQALNALGERSASKTSSSSNNYYASSLLMQDAPRGWRQLDDGIHVVSTAYIVGQSIVVHGISRHLGPSINSIPWTRCKVWFDQPNVAADNVQAALTVTFPVEVQRQLAVEVNADDTTWSTFTLNATISDEAVTSRPIAVAFYAVEFNKSTANDSAASISPGTMTPIIEVHQSPTKSTSTMMFNVAICGSAIFDGGGGGSRDQSIVDESILFQFIEYHRYVGVNRFVIYVDGLLPWVRRRLQLRSSKYNDRLVEIIPWNAPSSKSDRSIGAASSVVMKHDCMARLHQLGVSDYMYKYVVFLDANELIVPRSHAHLSNFVNNEAKVVSTDDADRALAGLRFDRRIFCTEFDDGLDGISEMEKFVALFKNDLVALPPMFTKTKWIAANAGTHGHNNGSSYLIEPSSLQDFSREGTPILKFGRHFLKVNEEFANVHVYVRCGENAERLVGQANSDDFVLRKMRDEFL